MLVATLAVAGCGGLALRFRPTTDAVRAPRDPRSVAVYTLRPPRAYIVVGYLHAQQENYGEASTPEMLEALRGEGARDGCDAVLVDHGFCAEDPTGRYALRSATASTLEATCLAEAP